MSQADVPLLILLLALFGMAIFIAAAEASLLRVPPVRVMAMADDGDRRATRLAGLLDRLSRVLNAILLVALLSQIGAATVTGVLAERWFGSLGVTISSIVLTAVLFVYAEAIPKTYAVRHATAVALALSGPVLTLERVLSPFVAVLVWFADIQIPGKGVTTSPTVTEDELRLLADQAADEGEITGHDAKLIARAFRVGDRRCDDVMVPRPDIVSVSEETTVAEATAIALEAGHRRLPVHRGDIEDVVGVVRLRTLAAVPPDRRDLPVGPLADRTLVVPESKRVLSLLEDMQETGTHLAIVVDEYGGTAGLVTIEDIVEELLGSVSIDGGEPEVVALDGGGWSIDGALPVEDLGDLLGVDPPTGGWNTVAGLMSGTAGRLLEVGDEVAVDGGRLRVLTTRGRRITRVAVEVE